MMTLRTLELLQRLALQERKRAIDCYLATNPADRLTLAARDREMVAAKRMADELANEISKAREGRTVDT